MDIFLDTACHTEIKKLMETGLISGVTTNPSLLAKEKAPPVETLRALCELNVGPISIEVTEEDAQGMIAQAETFISFSQDVVIKVPLTKEGLKACYALRERDIQVNVTLCFSAVQALLAAKAGASYISPFVGRVDDTGGSGEDLLREIRSIYDMYGYDTLILAASLRHPMHVLQACRAGADIVTLPPHVFEQLYSHPLTDKGIELFQKDWSTLSSTFIPTSLHTQS